MARFPFDSVTNSSIKLKNTPIEFQWNLRDASPSHILHSELQEGSESGCSPKRGTSEASVFLFGRDSLDDLHVGLHRQPRWFQPLPKLRIIPGILGVCPERSTRGALPLQISGGERKEAGDLESRHLIRLPNPSVDSTAHFSSPKPHFSLNVRRFVGHLWANRSTKSFARGHKN